MPDQPPSTTTRLGRRPGVNDTRSAILDAARARFAADGYAGTTVRKIAVDAGVDPSLVFRFFQSKEELFAAVLSIRPVALERFAAAFEAPTERIGEAVTRAFLEIWDGGSTESQPMLAMVRAAVANEQATGQLRDFIEARLLEDARAATAGDASARARAGVVSAMLVGLIVGRRIVEVPTLTALGFDELVAIVAPGIQAVLVPATTVR